MDGARSLAVLAATQPDRVGALIALSPSARSVILDDETLTAAATAAVVDGDLAASAGSLAPHYVADPVRRDRLERSIQSTVTPLQAERFMRMTLASDVTSILPLVQAPTLVRHPADAVIPSDAVRAFADLIPDAQFRSLPGRDLSLRARSRPVGGRHRGVLTGTAPVPVTQRVLATVLFTDLVDSTQRAARSGDPLWTDLLDRYFAAMRTIVSDHGGELIKTTGDGVLARFTGPAQAVRCAERSAVAAGDLGLEQRAGLHAGEVERSSDDVAGLAVVLAARITSIAAPGEILVSRTVKDLVIGSELTFADRGEHELKGMADRWPVYAVAV